MVVLHKLVGGLFINQAMSASVIYDLFMQTDNLLEQLDNIFTIENLENRPP